MNPLLANLRDFFRRWPYCVACGALALVLGGGASYWWSFNLAALKESVTRRTEEKDVGFVKLIGRANLEQRIAEVTVVTKLIEANLVDEGDLAANLGYFYGIEEQTKAQLPELHQVSSPTLESAGTFRRVPYGIRVLGSFEQVAGFLYTLETGPRLGRITSFSLSRADPAGQAITLDLNVDLLGKK